MYIYLLQFESEAGDNDGKGRQQDHDDGKGDDGGPSVVTPAPTAPTAPKRVRKSIPPKKGKSAPQPSSAERDIEILEKVTKVRIKNIVICF